MPWRSAVRLSALVAVLPLGTSLPTVAAQPVPLAIKGYDPVAYFAVGKPVRGLPEIEYEWNGYRYRFSRAEHRELFKADPKHYAPQFENYCAMALAKGALVEADPENWLINEGKLYIFGKPGPRRARSLSEGSFRKHRQGNSESVAHSQALVADTPGRPRCRRLVRRGGDPARPILVLVVEQEFELD